GEIEKHALAGREWLHVRVGSHCDAPGADQIRNLELRLLKAASEPIGEAHLGGVKKRENPRRDGETTHAASPIGVRPSAETPSASRYPRASATRFSSASLSMIRSSPRILTKSSSVSPSRWCRRLIKPAIAWSRL